MRVARTAARQLTEQLPEAVAAACVEFLYGPLAEHLHRVGAALYFTCQHTAIQQQQLEKCWRKLRAPRYAHLVVATIGSRWGFVDPSP